MKIYILILLLFPIICFSQKENNTTPAPSKPTTTDCPTWNNKSQTRSKADYYKSLRSMKPIKNQGTNNIEYPNRKPKYLTKKIEKSDSISSKKNDEGKSAVEETKIKKDTTDVTETDDSKIERKEKSDKEKEKPTKKSKRLPARNRTKVPKHNQNKCPEF